MAFPRPRRRRVAPGDGVCTPGQTFDGQVAAAVDDARERQDGMAFDSGQAINKMDGDLTQNQRWISGFRWDSITIPQGATIEVAYAEMYRNAASQDDPSANLHMEDVDDADDFNTTQDVLSRARTAASATWQEVDLGVGFSQTSSIVDPVQEIVDRGTWASGNAMVLLGVGRDDVDNRDYWPFAYEADTTKAPKLHIEFCA